MTIIIIPFVQGKISVVVLAVGGIVSAILLIPKVIGSRFRVQGSKVIVY